MCSAQQEGSRNFKVQKVYAKAVCSLVNVFFYIWQSHCKSNQKLHLSFGP